MFTLSCNWTPGTAYAAMAAALREAHAAVDSVDAGHPIHPRRNGAIEQFAWLAMRLTGTPRANWRYVR